MEGINDERPDTSYEFYCIVMDDAEFLGLIWEAEGNVSKAARRLGHEGARSFYRAIKRLRKFVNGDRSEDDPCYDLLFDFDSGQRRHRWTERGCELAMKGLESLQQKKRFAEEEEKRRRLHQHQAQCSADIYEGSNIVIESDSKASPFVVYYWCCSCGLLLRNFITREYENWRDGHHDLFWGPNRKFIELKDPELKLG